MDFQKAIEGIKCISCGEYDLAILNTSKQSANTGNEKKLTKRQKSFLENLNDILVQNRIDTPTRWAFESFLYRSGFHEGSESNTVSEFQIDSAIYEFERLSKKDRLLKNLKIFLFGQNEIPKIISDKLAHEISREILFVATNYRSLYRTLQLLFKPLITEITNFRVFKLLGYSAFSLYPDSPPREFWDIRLFATNEQYRDIIYYSQDISFLKKLQSDYIENFQYPKDFPGSLTFNSSSCSLLMTSISKNLHFVDLLALLIKEKLHKLEVGRIPEISRVAPALIPFFFAAYQPFLYLSPQIFLRLISAKLPSINNRENNYCYKNNNLSEKIIDLQQRFINDLLFTKLVVDLNNETFNSKNSTQNIQKTEKKKSFFSRKKKANDETPQSPNGSSKIRRNSDFSTFVRDFGGPVSEILKDHSIPYLCNGYYKRQEFLDFETKNFYIFSDEEAKKDFAFVRAFNALTDTVSLLQTTKERNQSIIPIQKSLLTSIELNLSSILDSSILTKVSIDIFSLLFIKESESEDSRYLCQNICIAYMLIKVLKKFFNNDRFIKFGELLLSRPNLLYSKKKIFAISEVLNSNLNLLFDTIVKRDWNGARELVLLLCGSQRNIHDERSRIYWRAYLLSLAVFQVISGKSCTIECSEFKEELNLEISLSSSIYNTDDCVNYVISLIEKVEKNEEKAKKLTLINDIKKIREKRKKIELEDYLSPLRDSFWIDVEPAVVNFEMFPFDFFTSKLFERYEKALKKSKRLFNFVNFVDLYFECINDKNNGNNRNLAFNPVSALSNAFNEGKIEVAERLAQMMKIDLFEFAMKHQKSFKFSADFVSYFSGKHPLECAEICYFSKEKQMKLNNLSEKVKKLFDYLVADKEKDDNKATLEEPIELEFIELIKSSKEKKDKELFKEFDDYLYKIGHSRVSQIVISNIDSIDKEVASYLLDIVGYTIDADSLSDEIKKLILLKETEKVVPSEITDKFSIVDRLIESKHFGLASRYIDLIIDDKKEREEVILKVISNFLKEGENNSPSSQICEFLSQFNDQAYLYELAASEKKEAIPVFIENCPISIIPILNAYSKLPDSIKTVSSLVDKSTITKAICDHIREKSDTDFVYQLGRENMILFTEKGEFLGQIIDTLADCCSTIENYMKVSSYLFSITEKSDTIEKIFQTTNSRRVSKELESIKVDSIEKEFEAFLLIRKVRKFNRMCPLFDKVSSIIKAFDLLLLESPFTFTRTGYSLDLLNSDKSDNKNRCIFDIFKLFDLDQVAFSLPDELFDSFTYTKQKVEIMLKLGKFDDALHLLNVNKRYVYEMDELFLSPFLYKQIFHSDMLLLISNQWSKHERYFSEISSISDPNSEFSVSLTSTLTNLLNYKEFVSNCLTKSSSLPFLSFCSDFCERFSTKDSFYRFCIRQGAMTTVVSKFMSLDELTNNCQQLFIQSIVECSIEYDKFPLLKKEMNNYSKASKSVINGYWSNLLTFCEKKGLGFLMLDVSTILSLKEKVALSYIEIFGEIEANKIAKKMEILEKVTGILTEIVKEQKSNLSEAVALAARAGSKKRRTRRQSGGGNNSISDNTDSSYSQQSSTILFDPEENQEICEYDEDDKNALKKNKRKLKVRYSFPELLLIAKSLPEILNFFLEEKIGFSEALNLFNGSLACIALGGFFLRKGKFNFLKKISEVMKIPQKAIINAFFESITEYYTGCFDITKGNSMGIENSMSSENSMDFEKVDDVEGGSVEIMRFVNETANEDNFWKNNNFFYVHLYVIKLSFSKNVGLIPDVLEKLLPPEKRPAMLLEFDFLDLAFNIIKEKNVAVELIPAIAARASDLGEYGMVKKCEDELGIKIDDKIELDLNE